MGLKPRVFLVILALALASCRGGSGYGVLRLAVLRGPSAVEAVRMIDSLTLCESLDAEVGIFDEPLQLRAEMMKGNVDFAVLPSTMAALMYNKGVDYRIVAVPIWGSLFLCGTDTGVQSPEDLKGRTVNMMARGMTPDILFRHLLEICGIDPDRDLTLDYRFPTHIDLANAAIAGRVEFCVLSEPYLSQVLNANPKLHLLLDLGELWRAREGIPLAETAFLCKGSLVGSRDSAIARITGSLRNSAQWVKMCPDSAAALSVKYGINPDAAAVEASIPRSGFDVRGTSEVENEIKNYLKVFLQASPEAVGGIMPDEDFFVR